LFRVNCYFSEMIPSVRDKGNCRTIAIWRYCG
jgi:hypothetical protein